MCEYLVVTTSLVACYKASFQKVQVTSMVQGADEEPKPKTASHNILAEKYGAQCARRG